MKFAAISILTTGLDPTKNDILEIGIIVEDTQNPKNIEEISKFRIWVDKEFYRGSPSALAEKSEVFKKIAKLRSENSKRLVSPDDVFNKIANFLRSHFAVNGQLNTPIPVAGKNFASFDKFFLSRLKNFSNIPFSPRVIDPTMYFINWNEDKVPPSLSESEVRAGITKESTMDTLDTAWRVISLLRTSYN